MKIIWKLLQTAIWVLLILCACSFHFDGIEFHLFVLHVKIYNLDNVFCIIAALSLARLFLDPALSSLKKYFYSPGHIFYWLAMSAAALAAGTFFWLYDDASRWGDGILQLRLTHEAWVSLRKYLEFFVLLFHVLCISFSQWASAKDEVKFHWILKKDCQIFSMGLFLPVIFIMYMNQERPHQAVPFFVLVVFWSVLFAFKAAISAKIHEKQGSSLDGFRYSRILLSLIALYTGVFIFLSVRRLDVYVSMGDFAVYLQPLWNTLHDRFMEINLFYTPPNESMNWFAEHFDLIYLLLLPIYKLCQNPRLFVMMQTILIAAAAWPLFQIAKLKLKDSAVAFCFAWAYLLNPFISRGLLNDFHAEAAEPLFIFLTFLMLEKKKWIPLLASAVLLLFCKEDASLYLVFFGVYALIRIKNWAQGTALICLGIFWLGWALEWAIPLFNKGLHVYHTLGERYPQLGKSFPQVLSHIVQHPLEIIGYLVDEQSLRNWGYLLIPLAALPLFYWASWLVILLPTLEMFLSQFRHMKRLTLHYPWFICPFFILGAVLALSYLKEKFPSLKSRTGRQFVFFYLFSSSLLFHYFFPQVTSETFQQFYNFAPWDRRFVYECYKLNDHDRKAKELIHRWIPEKESLSTDYRFNHDVSNRYVLRYFPEARDVRYIFVDIFWHPYVVQSEADLKIFKQELIPYLREGEFGVKSYEDGYLLLERGYDTSKNIQIAQDTVEFYEIDALTANTGIIAQDSQAYNKLARFVSAKTCHSGFIMMSHNHVFPAGSLEIHFRMKGKNFKKDSDACKIQLISQSGKIIQEWVLKPEDFLKSEDYQIFSFDYKNPARQTLSVNILYEQNGDIWADHFWSSCPEMNWDDIQANLNS